MTPLSHRLFVCAPGLAAVFLILLFAAPLRISGVSLTPNIAWLATILFARMPHISWPAWLAFLLGLLQDIVFGTPLGAQATITLAILLVLRARPSRVGQPLLRDMWLEAGALLVVAHVVLALILQWMPGAGVPLMATLTTTLVDILWVPLLAWMSSRLAMKLPK